MSRQFEPDRVYMQRLRQIFEAAVEMEPLALEQYLSEICAGDTQLHADVMGLLRGHHQPMNLLEQPAVLRIIAGASNTSAEGLCSGAVVAERFEVLAILGRGGMGIVYRAWDRSLQRTVALKLLSQERSKDPVFQGNLRREALALASLRHPNICSVHDVFLHEGRDCIVMECLEGETLAARVRSGGTLKTAELVSIGLELCRALQYAHDHGVLHRDLKPANIMLTPEGVKLLDFGIASLTHSRESRSVSTHSTIISATVGTASAGGNRAGTVQYMSPEQVRGEPLDARTDLFSLGVVLYEMATSTIPFQGETLSDVLDAVLHTEPLPIARANRTSPRALQDIVSKCLAKPREFRFPSALATENALRAITDKPGVEPAEDAFAPNLRSTRKAIRMWGTCALIAALVCVPVYRNFDLRSAVHVRYPQAAAVNWARETGRQLGCSTGGLKPRTSIAPSFEMDEVLSTEGIAVARRIIESGYSFAWQIDFDKDASLGPAAGPGCSVLLDVSGQLLEYRSHSRSSLIVGGSQAIEKRVTELAKALLHLPANSSPGLSVGEWSVPGAAPGWHEQFSVSLGENGQVLGLSRLFLRDRSARTSIKDDRASTLLHGTGATVLIGLYCYGLFILLTRRRYLVLPWRVPALLAVSPALSTAWLVCASALMVDRPDVLCSPAITAFLITFAITLPAIAGLIASLRHTDYGLTAGIEDILKAQVNLGTVTQIAQGVLVGGVVAGLYILQSVLVQWNGGIPGMSEFQMGLVGGTPWMFGEVGLALCAGASTIAMLMTYSGTKRLLQAPRTALLISAALLALVSADSQTLHLLPLVLQVLAMVCLLIVYRSSGLLAALIANLSSLMFFASIVGFHLSNDRFVSQSFAIAAFPFLLLASAWIVYEAKKRWRPSGHRTERSAGSPTAEHL